MSKLTMDQAKVLFEIYVDALGDLEVFKNTDSQISTRSVEGKHEIINTIYDQLSESDYQIKHELTKRDE